MNFVFIRGDSGELFIVESDPSTTATPLLNGVVVQQQPRREVHQRFAERQHGDFAHGHSAVCNRSGIPKTVVGCSPPTAAAPYSLTYDENF